jgi:hypothetical protein
MRRRRQVALVSDVAGDQSVAAYGGMNHRTGRATGPRPMNIFEVGHQDHRRAPSVPVTLDNNQSIVT